MNTNHMTPAADNDYGNSKKDDSGSGSAGEVSALLAFSVIVAIALSAWLVFSASVTHVSAAAADESSTPQVPYFPSQYVNQASEPSAVPATF
jgi:hypothetical protein